MRAFDFSPLYRSSVGFDHLVSMLDSATRSAKNVGYPPYNIELVDEDKYRITMAVAGFKQSEISIEVERNNLTVTGKKADDENERHYLHQGIAGRNFERQFQLADHVVVKGAKMEDGLLHVSLQRELPEAMKPRTIQIESDDVNERKVIESENIA